MAQTERSETPPHKIQTPGNHAKEKYNEVDINGTVGMKLFTHKK